MCSSNHSGWEPYSLFHSQAKTGEISGMIMSFRDKEWGLYSKCCEKSFRALRREKGVQESSLMQCPVWFSCRHRQGQCYHHGMPVTSVWSVFSQKSVTVELFPRGAEGIRHAAWKKDRKIDFILLALLIFIVSFVFIEKKDSSFFLFKSFLARISQVSLFTQLCLKSRINIFSRKILTCLIMVIIYYLFSSGAE